MSKKKKKPDHHLEPPVVAQLRDYQRAGVNFIKTANRVGLFLDMGLGKATDNESPILTTDGWKTVGDIKVGDYLYDRTGKPTKVLAVYPQGKVQAYKVTLKDGRSFICCDEHLIPHYTRYSYTKKEIRIKPLKELKDSYKIPSKKSSSTTYEYSLPQNEAVEFKERHHTIHPYALGVLIGNGILQNSGLTLATKDKEIVYKVADLLGVPHGNTSINDKHHRAYYSYHNQVELVKNELLRLRLKDTRSHERFIPESYLYDTIANRKQLLCGLMDSNGRVRHHGKNAFNYEYLTISKQLADDISLLCRSLGYGVTILEDKRTDVHKYGNYAVKIHTNDTIVTAEKHLDKLMNRTYKGVLDEKISIVDIQEVEPREMTCFTVDNPEHMYLINDYIVTHNTLTSLTALTELAQEGRLHGHVLIIAPKRVALNTWPDEIEKWSHTRGARFVVLSGLTKKKRDALLDEVESSPPTIYIINRELVPKLVERFPDKKWKFLNVIIDEAQSFKGYNTKGFKALKSIAPYTHRMILLTGTPSPNSLMDIWSLIYLLDGGQRLGHNITAYRNRHFLPGRRTPEGYPYEWLLIDGHDQYIHDQIKDITISMMKSDYLDMPDITHNPVYVEMTTQERKVYNKLRKEKVLPLLNGDAIEASNAAVLSGALLQLSNGAIYADEEKKQIIELHDHKIKALEEIVDGANGQPILCFYWFQHDLLRLTKAFPDAEVFGDKDPTQLTRWNNKEIPLLFAHPASAGHGLNFQHGGHIMVFFVIPRSLELYQQSVARLHRSGQSQAVIVHYLMTRGTVEDRILATLQEKENMQQALIDAVKADLEDLM